MRRRGDISADIEPVRTHITTAVPLDATAHLDTATVHSTTIEPTKQAALTYTETFTLGDVTADRATVLALFLDRDGRLRGTTRRTRTPDPEQVELTGDRHYLGILEDPTAEQITTLAIRVFDSAARL